MAQVGFFFVGSLHLIYIAKMGRIGSWRALDSRRILPTSLLPTATPVACLNASSHEIDTKVPHGVIRGGKRLFLKLYMYHKPFPHTSQSQARRFIVHHISSAKSIKMGGLHAVEDRPTPKEVYNWRLYTEALIIATGSLL